MLETRLRLVGVSHKTDDLTISRDAGFVQESECLHYVGRQKAIGSSYEDRLVRKAMPREIVTGNARDILLDDAVPFIHAASVSRLER